jgi:4-diphosphocytidyl-2-C-methyl-D-erythritol kinase
VATASVYRALASVGYPMAEPLPSLPEGQAPPWRNDLAGAAVFVCPVLGEVRDALVEAGGEPLLCGSGSCWAARFADSSARDGAETRIREDHPNWGVWPV